jgi:LuxR family maltose regulon positive regulatory protein
LLQSPQPPASKTILTILLNDLSLLDGEDSPPRVRYVLVLEDYHVITAQPIHEVVTYLIDHVPPHVHVIITTRADPPLPFPRWRGRDQLSEIRAADLRFTPDEAAAFLNDRMGLDLSVDDVMRLEIRTEGWITGLQLVALSLQGRANKADFLQTFSGSHRYVLNYLVEEVLNLQPKAVQEFLLRTSILDRLCGPLCDMVLDDWMYKFDFDPTFGIDTSSYQVQSVLEEIEQANLFLTPLDDEGKWYRYHPLFAEVLQHRLRQTQPEVLPHLHGQASVWYEQQGLLADAIHHALRAADFPRMAELIEQSWQAVWNQGAVATLLNWVHALPSEALVARPGLAISYAWALALAGQIEAAEAGLQQVEALLQGAGAEFEVASTARNTMLGRIASLQAMMAARRGDPVQAIQLAQHALRLIPADAALLRGNACYALGLACQQNGVLPEALRAYQEATRLGETANDHFLTVAARYHEGRTWMAQGQLRMAANIYQQLLTTAAQHARPVPVVGLVHVGYAEILYQWNDLVAATHQVESGLALSPSGSLAYTDGPLHRFLILARIRHAMGDLEGTLAAIQLAMETARQTGLALDGARVAALDALMHLRLGQPEVAGQWAQGYAHLVAHEDRFTYVHEFETLVFVRVLLAQGRANEVLSLFARWLPDAEAVQRIGSLIEMYMLQAQALGSSGPAAEARRTMLRALTLAEPEGYVRLFMDEGEPLRLLIADCRSEIAAGASGAPLREYVDTLLAAFDEQRAITSPISPSVASNSIQTGVDTSIGSPQSAVANLVELLTVRELETLRLVATGLSNAAIAAQLVVSVGTVKSHLKHIYSKLAVESRTQAVAQARKLGLL